MGWESLRILYVLTELSSKFPLLLGCNKGYNLSTVEMKMHWKMKNISKSCHHFGSRVILLTFGCSLFQFWFFFHHVSRHLTVYIAFSLFDQEDNYSVLLYISFYSLTDFSQYKHVIFSLVWKQEKKQSKWSFTKILSFDWQLNVFWKIVGKM